jgi:putative copper export protein
MMITEIFWYGSFSSLVFLALSPHPPEWLTGLNGIGIAFAAVQIATMLGGMWYARVQLGVRLTGRTQAIWFGGLAMILICATATWHHRQTEWLVSVPLAFMTLVASALLAGPRRWNEVRAVVSGWRAR